LENPVIPESVEVPLGGRPNQLAIASPSNIHAAFTGNSNTANDVLNTIMASCTSALETLRPLEGAQVGRAKSTIAFIIGRLELEIANK
jgi:hypothetical protein